MRKGRVPLRTVLQNFINHVDSIEKQRIDGEDLYEKEFQELKAITESLKNEPGFECSHGEKEENRRKNRYKDILPYDYTRVVLKPTSSDAGDYINANYIKGAGGSRAYIACQGPLPHTLDDFWRMVVQCDVQVIVMASNETEGGKHKCECYWACEAGERRQFGEVGVSFVKSRQVCPDFLVRTLKITFPGDGGEAETRIVCQFHYSLWPDHGVPDSVKPLLAMVRLVRECQASETLPLLVHCSAGCGRTGTICAIDHVWTLLRTGRLPDCVDLLTMVKDMRRQRVAMVQTRDQYMLLHRALRHLFTDRLALIDEHPYANIAVDGSPLGLHHPASHKPTHNRNGSGSNTPTGISSPISTPASTPISTNTSINNSINTSTHASINTSTKTGTDISKASVNKAVPNSNGYADKSEESCSLRTSDGRTQDTSDASRAHRKDQQQETPSFSGVLGSSPTGLLSPQNHRSDQTEPQSPRCGSSELPEKNDCICRTDGSSCSSGRKCGVKESNVDEVDSSSDSSWRLRLKYQPQQQSRSQLQSPQSQSQLQSPQSQQQSPLLQQQFQSHVQPQHQRLLQPQPLRGSLSPQSTPYSTPLSTPQGGTPSATPNTTPGPLQGIGLLSPPQPPTPPTRSQTPSPVIALNMRAYEGCHSQQQHGHQQQGKQQGQQHFNNYVNSPQMLTQSLDSAARNQLSGQKGNFTLTDVKQAHQSQWGATGSRSQRGFTDGQNQRDFTDSQNQRDLTDSQNQHQGSFTAVHGLRSQGLKGFLEAGFDDQNPNQNNSVPANARVSAVKKPRKSMELNRRPSINKLKQLFETNKPEIFPNVACDETRPSSSSVKLSRSASSVTLRSSSLSLASDVGVKSMRLRRRPGLGSEESINFLQAPTYNASQNSDKISEFSKRVDHEMSTAAGLSLRICPPPPPLNERRNLEINRNVRSVEPDSLLSKSTNFSDDAARLCKPPSLPLHVSPNTKRRQHLRDHPSPLGTRIIVDERPALPVKLKKKSQSFRYAREQTPSSPLSNRSPDFSRKAVNEVNNYFSLERTKVESHSVASDKTCQQRRFGDVNSLPSESDEQTIFPSTGISSQISRPTTLFNDNDIRPQIPPKKSVQNRTKGIGSEVFGSSAPALSNSLDRSSSNCYAPKLLAAEAWKSSISSDSDQSLYDQLPCQGQQPHNSTTHKPYVNARLVRVADSASGEREVYFPMPSRRNIPGTNKPSPDYANYPEDDWLGHAAGGSSRSLPRNSMNAAPKSMPGSSTSMDMSPVEGKIQNAHMHSLDDVSAFPSKNYTNTSSYLKSVQELNTVRGALASANKAVTHEPIDFGEHSNAGSDDDVVVEVVNKEIVGENYRLEGSSSRPICLPNEDSLRNSLDSIARQVYQDCENYLLHGSNKSEVPNLMPTHAKKSYKNSANQESSSSRSSVDETSSSSSVGRNSRCLREATKQNGNRDDDPDVFTSEVKSRVSIAPPGLRTRERSNSYRQAVRNVPSNWKPKLQNLVDENLIMTDSMTSSYITESPEESQSEANSMSEELGNHMKSVNKYETIWFEKVRETGRSDENSRSACNVANDRRTEGNKWNEINNTSCISSSQDEGSSQRSVSSKRLHHPGSPGSGLWDRNFLGQTEEVSGPANSSEQSRASNTQAASNATSDENNHNNNQREEMAGSKRFPSSSVAKSGQFNGNLPSPSKEPIYVNTSELRATTQPHHRLTTSRPAANSSIVHSNYVDHANNNGNDKSCGLEPESFSLIPKPQGPSSTTPPKQISRAPFAPYMEVPLPKGLATSENAARSVISSTNTPNFPNFGDHRLQSYGKFLSESGQSRSLPPPPPPSSFKSKNPHQHFPSMERSAPLKPHSGAMLEPLYLSPIDAKREPEPVKGFPNQHSEVKISNSQGRRNFQNSYAVSRGVEDERHGNVACLSHGMPRAGHMARPPHGASAEFPYASSKAHIIGDFAIVGDSAVRLRRGARPPGGDLQPAVPVAPPRVKRHSAVGGAETPPDPGRQGTSDGRYTTTSPQLHRRSVHGAGGVEGNPPASPPALPAKTALHLLLPPPVPPATLSSCTSPAHAPLISSSMHSHGNFTSCNNQSFAPSGPQDSDNLVPVSRSRGNSSSMGDLSRTGDPPEDGPTRGTQEVGQRQSPNNTKLPDIKKRNGKRDEQQLKRQSYHGGNSGTNTTSTHHHHNTSDSYYHHHHHHQHSMVQHQHHHHGPHSSSSSSTTQGPAKQGTTKTSSDLSNTSSSSSDPRLHNANGRHKSDKPYSSPPSTSSSGHSQTQLQSSLASSSNSSAGQDGTSSPNRRASGDVLSVGAPSFFGGSTLKPYQHTSTSSPSHHTPPSNTDSMSSPEHLGKSSPHHPGSSPPHHPGSSPSHHPITSHPPNSPHAYLQRSLTSSAILVRSPNQSQPQNRSLERPDKINGVDTVSKTPPNPQATSKFSMPNLFKKFRGNVNSSTKLSPLQLAKKSYVHPNRGAGKQGTDVGGGDGVMSSYVGDEVMSQCGGDGVMSSQYKDERVMSQYGGDGATNVVGAQNDDDDAGQKPSGKKKNQKLPSSKGNVNKSRKVGAESRCQVPENVQDSAEDRSASASQKSKIPNAADSSNSSSSPYSFKGKSSKKGSKPDSNKKNNSTNESRYTGPESPTSPKPLARALGKFKFMRSLTGDQTDSGLSSSSSNGSTVKNKTSDNNSNGNGCSGNGSNGNGSNGSMSPLQKSASVGHSMFTSVVQDCGFPRSQKARRPSASPPPARQQYL
ncbi:uncharacterized protein LOC108680035 isoform X2 [Hyalella azteca]|uniref:protein-tyrosine-phosphatase n=1 Tax=Hyalella azteca TaxID=294128 RepID=A0A979FL20_HYAAZ|nr:uncharacterized protein LOC108680035 isoform X2 [Hyalella azteca]